MLLGIDIGNTTIYFGLIEKDEVIKTFRIDTIKDASFGEYLKIIKNILEENIELSKIKNVIISSVVPEITSIIEETILKILKIKSIVVKRDVKEQFKISGNSLRDLGADLISDATGALEKYRAPLIIFDMGTATTCCVVNKEKQFMGGLICPGLKTGMNALIGKASQLSGFELRTPKELVGTETTECINSGVIFGHCEMINGLKKRIEKETGEKYTVILTGGNSDFVSNYVDKDIIQDKNLIFYGLNSLFKRYNV